MNKQLDVIVLGALSAIGLVFIGLFALLHAGSGLPTELVALETGIVGVLGGRVMPAMVTTSPSAAASSSSSAPVSDPAAGVTVVQ